MERIVILGVFAHPDDEFAISGLISNSISMGAEVHLVSATKGEAGKIRNDKAKLLNKKSVANIRQEEYIESCNHLKITKYHFLDLIDGESKKWDFPIAISRLINIIREINPTHIISFDMNGCNGHPDHIATSRIVKEASSSIENLEFIQVKMYPKWFLEKRLWWLPKQVRDKIITKFGVDNNSVTSIFTLNRSELSNKLKLLKIYSSQFPDEKNRYYKQNKFIIRQFAKYECYFEESGKGLEILRRLGWNFR